MSKVSRKLLKFFRCGEIYVLFHIETQWKLKAWKNLTWKNVGSVWKILLKTTSQNAQIRSSPC